MRGTRMLLVTVVALFALTPAACGEHVPRDRDG